MRRRPSTPAPTVIVDNRVRLRGFSPDVEEAVCTAFTHPNPNYYRLKAIKVFAEKEWRTWKYEKSVETRVLSVPRGGLRRVLGILDEHVVTRGELLDGTSQAPADAMYDVREFPKWSDLGDEIASRWGRWRTHGGEEVSSRVELRYYQAEIVRELAAKGTMLARSPSGSGKTTAGIACFRELRVPTLVLVWSTAVQKEWAKRFQSELGAHVNTVTQWAKKAPLSVLTCQGFTKVAEEHRNVFGLAIFDEVQRASAKTFFHCVDSLAASYKLGVSADERRSDGKECITRDLFGDVEVDVDRQTLVDEGHVLDVELRVVPWDAPAPEKVVASRAAFKAVQDGVATSEERALARTVTENHHAILDGILADEPRRRVFARIVEDELATGAKVLVLTSLREQTERLMRALSIYHPVSLLGGDVARGLEALERGDLRLAVGTYQAVGTGMNLPDFEVGVFVDPCHHDERNLRQFTSRLNRPYPGKKPRAYVPCDSGPYGLEPAKSYARWFEKVFVRISGGELFSDLVPARDWLKRQ